MGVKVYKRTKTNRSIFRKIPFGALYWAAASRTVAPTVKSGRATSQGGQTVATGVPTQTAVTDTSAAVVRVPRQWTRKVG